jgi:hypothetical protein
MEQFIVNTDLLNKSAEDLTPDEQQHLELAYTRFAEGHRVTVATADDELHVAWIIHLLARELRSALREGAAQGFVFVELSLFDPDGPLHISNLPIPTATTPVPPTPTG